MNEKVILFTAGLAFIITVVLSPIFIPFLRRLKFGQSIQKKDQNLIKKIRYAYDGRVNDFIVAFYHHMDHERYIF